MLRQGKEARKRVRTPHRKGKRWETVGGTTPWPDCIFLASYVDLTLISGPTKMEWLLYG